MKLDVADVSRLLHGRPFPAALSNVKRTPRSTEFDRGAIVAATFYFSGAFAD